MANDYISRDYAVEKMENFPWDTEHDKNAAIHLVRELVPAADVRPVVLCRDCKHWTGINCGYCEVWEHYISNQDYFCGSGERNGGADDA